MLSKYGTEQVGISAELALADLTGLEVNAEYRSRGREELIEHIRPALVTIVGDFPTPTKHIAEDQNPIDFLLDGSETLSLKSNMRDLGKVAPQNIGQPTSSTFWGKLPQLVPPGISINTLSYSQSAQVFKKVALTKTVELLEEYWNNLFDCDYLIYVYDVLDKHNNLSHMPKVKLFKKSESPHWEQSQIEFTRTLSNWNESCTVKYGANSIGEFQIHNNRNCFKFRFNLNGLIKAGLL